MPKKTTPPKKKTPPKKSAPKPKGFRAFGEAIDVSKAKTVSITKSKRGGILVKVK